MSHNYTSPVGPVWLKIYYTTIQRRCNSLCRTEQYQQNYSLAACSLLFRYTVVSTSYSFPYTNVISIIINLFLFTVRRRPFPCPSNLQCLPCDALVHYLPLKFVISSFHQVNGLPLLLPPSLVIMDKWRYCCTPHRTSIKCLWQGHRYMALRNQACCVQKEGSTLQYLPGNTKQRLISITKQSC